MLLAAFFPGLSGVGRGLVLVDLGSGPAASEAPDIGGAGLLGDDGSCAVSWASLCALSLSRYLWGRTSLCSLLGVLRAV